MLLIAPLEEEDTNNYNDMRRDSQAKPAGIMMTCGFLHSVLL